MLSVYVLSVFYNFLFLGLGGLYWIYVFLPFIFSPICFILMFCLYIFVFIIPYCHSFLMVNCVCFLLRWFGFGCEVFIDISLLMQQIHAHWFCCISIEIFLVLSAGYWKTSQVFCSGVR
jgi:hypothetical protein